MLKDLTIEAEARDVTGKRASRKLSRKALMPGILYGGADLPVMFQIDPRKIDAVLHSGTGTNTLFKFSVAGSAGPTLAMIKALQQDPLTGKTIHADILRISMDKTIQVKVPIHVVGTARGVKQQGGILDFMLREVEVSCLPGDIPDRIDVDVQDLDLGKAIKVQELMISDKVKVLTDPNRAVAAVVAPAAEKAAEAAAAEAAPEAPAEPEVIKKGKAEAAEGEEAAEGGKPEKVAKEKPEKAAKEKPEKGAKEKPERGAKEKPERGGKERGGR